MMKRQMTRVIYCIQVKNLDADWSYFRWIEGKKGQPCGETTLHIIKAFCMPEKKKALSFFDQLVKDHPNCDFRLYEVLEMWNEYGEIDGEASRPLGDEPTTKMNEALEPGCSLTEPCPVCSLPMPA